jgi:Secretion system C-terminal sorting domain
MTFQLFGQQTIGKEEIPFFVSNGKLVALRDITIHTSVTIKVPQSFITGLGLSPNATIDFDGTLRLVSSATIEGNNAVWRNVTLSFGNKVFNIRQVEINQDGAEESRLMYVFPIITVKQPQLPYQKPDKVWTISTTQTWQRPSHLNSVYPSNASSATDALFKSNSARDVALLAQLNSSSIGKANAYIKFGNGNTTGRLVKPFIIIDGIDFGSYSMQYTDNSVDNPTDITNKIIRYGDVGWDLLQMGTDESKLDPDDPSDREFLQNYPVMFNALLSEGYDIVFLDFERGADYIQKNAVLLMELIRKVNSEKVYHDCQHRNIVLGASMGGQVARYALRTMENLGEDHDTRTYVSFDSPQKGANIPLSVQAAALWLHKLGLPSADLSLWQRLNLPAARQLIINQLGIEAYSTSSNGILFKWNKPSQDRVELEPMNYWGLQNHYEGEMSDLGYPRQTKNIALACGSFQGATQGYVGGSSIFNASVGGSGNGYSATVACLVLNSAGQQLSDTELRATSVSCDFRPVSNGDLQLADAVTNSTTRSTIGTNILFGAAIPSSFCLPNISGFKFPCKYDNALALVLRSPTPLYDNAPGGYRQDLVQVKGLLNSVAAGFLTDGLSVDFHGLPGLVNKKQAFISVASAFGLQEYLANGNDAVNASMFQNFEDKKPQLLANRITPFDDIFAPSSNLKHVEVNQEMITWLMEKIQLQGSGLPSTLINQSYNFANQSVNEIPQVSIGVGATVKINGTGGAGLGNEPNNAPNPFTVSTSLNCGNSTIDVGQTATIGQTGNGVFRIGEGTRVGILRIRDKGIMTVLQNGTLQIDDNSQLIVENGGRLIINMGANINLLGVNARIIVQNGGHLIINGGNFNLNPNGTPNSFNAETAIQIQSGGEMVLNDNFTYAGVGAIRFDFGHIFTLNTNFNLRGSDVNSSFIVLSEAPWGSVNRLTIQNRAFRLRYARVTFEKRSEIDIRNGTNQNTVEDVFFNGQWNATALRFTDVSNVSVQRCSFTGLFQGIDINCAGNLNGSISVGRCTFSLVDIGLTIKASLTNQPFPVPEYSVNDCTFTFQDWMGWYTIPTAIGCRFENLLYGLRFNNNRITGVRNGNVWENHTGVELRNTTIDVRGGRLHDLRTGISAEKENNNNVHLHEMELSGCEIGINIVGGVASSFSNLPYGRVQLECTHLIDNQTGVRGEQVDLWLNDGSNNFRTAPDGLLFDICQSRNEDLIRANANFWEGGFDAMRFNIISGNLCSRGARLSLRQCVELTTEPTDCPPNGTNCCNIVSTTYDGSGTGVTGTVIQCLVAQNNNQTQQSKAENKAQGNDNDNVVTAKSSNNKWAIFPNPANETVQLAIEDGKYHLNVSNTVGQTIFTQNTEGSLSVDVSTWANGIYLFEVTDKATNKRQRSKMVVQH